ncbi:MAG: hypothetical protein CMI95_03095 [Pelagibacteraceae bacterium]|nr:hypothetical protein [Pelagibacteraceae bacterium]|tara:strand:- start:23101 stop:23631 length:531 start_codon:yes stop_codon:yes gene_type:complete
MFRKKIFYKKNSLKKIYIFTFLFISSFSLYFFYINNLIFTNKEYFIIEPVKNDFFIIPNDTGGKIILDYDISILKNHINDNIDSSKNNILFDSNYSIQLFASINFDDISKQKLFYINKFNLAEKNLFTIKINTNLDSFYMLLFNTYENRDDAILNCANLFNKTINCIVVNLQNINN